MIGSLGKDAIVNNVNGKSVINFSVAHSEKFSNAAGESQERTIWVECAKWGEKTGIAPYLKKGTKVFVEGNPDVKTYTTKDGKQGASITLRVLDIQLLSAAGDNNSPSNNAQAAAPTTDLAGNAVGAAAASLVDDLPF